eukprot:Platyproteum_vivax@DN5193_c0_g1_i1.p1
MARNEEKALSMLNRWVSMKQSLARGDTASRRAKLSSDCTNIREAENRRREQIQEISRKINEIQNAGLGEHRIRDLNDEINRDLRRKTRWEHRIRELGGPDYISSAPKIVDAYGAELTGQGGYRYFGAAKDLPGVRELFEKEVAEAPRRNRADLYRNITPDYYGWRDEEDESLLLAEQEAEQSLVATAVVDWQERQAAGGLEVSEETAETLAAQKEIYNQRLLSAPKAYISLPNSKEIEKVLLEKKKQILLSKYITKSQAKEQAEAEELLGQKAGG